MPILFEEGWDRLQLSRLKVDETAAGAESVRDIAMFWRAKARLHKHGPKRIAEIDAFAANHPSDMKKHILRNTLEANAEARDVISSSIDRDKVKSSTIRKLAPELENKFSKVRTKREFDTAMEDIHNDRLRISDMAMLREFSAISIVSAIFEAKHRFTRDQRVARLFALATSINPGDAFVKVTQGVHQADDPHFDVLFPGEAQQYHVEVVNAHPLRIRSVSYMLGPRKSDGTCKVEPDQPPAAAAAAPTGS